MASPHTRTLRALDADGSGASWWAWLIAGGLGLAWLAWFFGSSVTVYAISRSANLAPPPTAAAAERERAGPLIMQAVFAWDAPTERIRPGQTARVHFEPLSGSQPGGLPARVTHVDATHPEQGLRVELNLLPATLPMDLHLPAGLGGRVELALEAMSPAQWLWRSLALRSVGPRSPIPAPAEPRR